MVSELCSITHCICVKNPGSQRARKLVRRHTHPDVNRYSGHESLCFFSARLQRDRRVVVSIAGFELVIVADGRTAGHKWNGDFFAWLQCSAFARESRGKNVLPKWRK